MATVEIELRNYTKQKTKTGKDGKKVVVKATNGLQPLVLRITSGNKVSRKNTGLYIKASEWDSDKRQVNRKHSEWARLNDALDVLRKEAEASKADAIKERRAVVPAAIIAAVFSTTDFFELMEDRIEFFRKQNKHFTADNYRSVLSVLKLYVKQVHGYEHLQVGAMTSKFIEHYRSYLLLGSTEKGKESKARKPNTVVTHLSKIAAVLNNSDTKEENPFDNVSRGTFKRTAAKPLYLEDIEALKLHIPNGYWEAVAKDTFLFSFYAAGMSSKDILLLTWEDIHRGRIDFSRRKVAETSGVHLSIPLNKVTEGILAKYDRSTATVFNLVKILPNGKGSENSKEANKERAVIQASINKALKSIGLNSPIKKSFSFKDARTAFATIANEASGRNVYGIQQAMGHSKIGTTEIYLGSDNRAVDELLKSVY